LSRGSDLQSGRAVAHRPAWPRTPGVLVDESVWEEAPTSLADQQQSIPAVVAALEAHGVSATAVTLARPSLEDVYLPVERSTGRTPSSRRQPRDRAQAEQSWHVYLRGVRLRT